jgi:hypothetical protein
MIEVTYSSRSVTEDGRSITSEVTDRLLDADYFTVDTGRLYVWKVNVPHPLAIYDVANWCRAIKNSVDRNP